MQKDEDTLTRSFEVLEPPKRTATLLDQEIDLTIIPARTSLKFVSFSKKYGNSKLDNIKDEVGLDEEMLSEMLDIIGEITTRSNPTVTKDWLLENLQLADLTRFMVFVFEGFKKKSDGKPDQAEGKPGSKTAQGGASGKNLT